MDEGSDVRMMNRNERGAAAVEFALIAPLLILFTVGIVAFGHVYHVQTVIDNAARDAVRIFSLQDDDAGAEARATAIDSAATAVTLSDDQVDIPADCPVGTNATITITITDFQLFGGLWAVDLRGSGTMRCNG